MNKQAYALQKLGKITPLMDGSGDKFVDTDKSLKNKQKKEMRKAQVLPTVAGAAIGGGASALSKKVHPGVGAAIGGGLGYLSGIPKRRKMKRRHKGEQLVNTLDQMINDIEKQEEGGGGEWNLKEEGETHNIFTLE